MQDVDNESWFAAIFSLKKASVLEQQGPQEIENSAGQGRQKDKGNYAEYTALHESSNGDSHSTILQTMLSQGLCMIWKYLSLTRCCVI